MKAAVDWVEHTFALIRSEFECRTPSLLVTSVSANTLFFDSGCRRNRQLCDGGVGGGAEFVAPLSHATPQVTQGNAEVSQTQT